MSMVDGFNSMARKVPVWAIYALGAVPAALLVAQIATGDLGVDPVKTVEQRLGVVGLQFLLAGLMISPLRQWAGLNLLRFRRAIGLLAFAYIALHLTTWLVLDIQLRWSEIWADILKRPYVTVGMAGFVALLPLAITSNNASVRRLGAAAWKRLHKLTYVAAFAGALHYLMLVKAWPIEPILYFGVMLGLLTLRVVGNRSVAKRTEPKRQDMQTG